MAARPPPLDRLKRAIDDMMTDLDEEVDAGNVRDGAYKKLCDGLMGVHAAKDALAPSIRRKANRDMLYDMLVLNPRSASTIPSAYRALLTPDFFRVLLARKHSLFGYCNDDEWLDRLLEGFLPVPSLLSGALQSDCWAVLRTRFNTLDPLVRHLDKSGVVPAMLFPCLPGWTDLEPASLNKDLLDMIQADARFVMWLLKAGCGYTSTEQSNIRAVAITESQAKDGYDARFQKALGLQSYKEFVDMQKNIRTGSTYEQALALTEDARLLLLRRFQAELQTPRPIPLDEKPNPSGSIYVASRVETVTGKSARFEGGGATMRSSPNLAAHAGLRGRAVGEAGPVPVARKHARALDAADVGRGGLLERQRAQLGLDRARHEAHRRHVAAQREARQRRHVRVGGEARARDRRAGADA